MAALPSSADGTNGPEPAGPLSGVILRTVVLATLVVAGIALLFAFVIRFHLILFLFLVAIILATVTRPAVDGLARRGIRPQIGVIMVYLALLAVIALFAALVAPLIIGQVDSVTARLPALYTDLRQTLTSTENRLVQRLASGLPEQLAMPAPVASPVTADGLPSFAPASALVKVAGRAGFLVIAILALAFYWVTEGELITRRALLFVRADRRVQARIVWAEMEGKIGGFFRGQLLLMGIVAALSATGYFIVGMPYALGLALVAGVCEAIPMVGPIIGMIPAALVALSIAPDKLPAVILIGVVVQLLENNLLVPRIMDRSVGVNPVVTILAIAAFGALFGLAGALLAIPLAAMMQIIVQRLLLLRNAVPEVGRSRVSILRLAAGELVADVRKGMAADDREIVTPETETAEDRLEAIAADLDSMLAAVEAEA
jgi:predicted PurR-regulated permease PerM